MNTGASLLWFGLLSVASSLPTATAGWTIVATAVEGDGATPVADARFTLFPDSLDFVSDEHGHILIPWDGRRGYIHVRAPEEPFCKRIALYGKPTAEADSTLDLGLIVSVPSRRPVSRGKAIAASGSVAPDTIRAAGPLPGEPDRCWMIMLVVTDLYGQPTVVEQYNTDELAPEGLRRAVVEFLRSLTWQVNLESPCADAEPFRNMVPFTYWWRDGVWLLAPNTGSQKDAQGGAGSDPHSHK